MSGGVIAAIVTISTICLVGGVVAIYVRLFHHAVSSIGHIRRPAKALP
jgi:hypothetical protein